MPQVYSWLESALRRERDEMAMRHTELMQELHMLLRQAEKIQAPAQDVQINLDAGYERHTSGATEPLDRSVSNSKEAKESGQKPEFHVVRIEGQTKVKRDSKDETKKRAYGSHFDKMDKRSASFNQDSTSKLFRMVTHPLFESIICAIIVANTVVMAFEAQYYGLQVGYDLGMRTYDLPSAIAWPGADFVWELSEWLFGPIFLIELLLKLAGMKFTFFLDVWNWFDALTVIAWLIDTVFRGFWPIDPMLLRLAKLGRLLRLMRLVRKLKGFDALYILTTALRGSVTVLLWSFLMLFLLQLIFALFLQRIVQDTITFGDRSVQVNEELFLYFGTCTRCLLTMFEITLGNWPPVARLLQDHVHEAFCAFSIIHKITVGYALIAVINGVFLKETFSAAENDDKIRMRNTEKKRNQHIKKMQSLFEAADETGDGVLDRDEFIQVMSDPEIVNWLAAMDLQIADPNALFEMVQGDLAESEKSEGTINAEQLVMGVSRLKGAARSTDMHTLTAEVRKLHHRFERGGGQVRPSLPAATMPHRYFPRSRRSEPRRIRKRPAGGAAKLPPSAPERLGCHRPVTGR
ncbi:Sodium channel protein 60E (Drosophila ion channel 60) (Drosophila sodium channel 1) (Protein smell-impaired 60E) (Sodium channel 2) (DmNav2) [Durusdinium trenchii]|uniref:Sodium channel protein 60E (Drosophila ion channel 60) (Drosophila sodium channel 1) (Protein smell-impaired 60E) (Sodium channel 2) (DmNav2) n=1 Tax=Durusdinium trenchii TaxID=1381693 RepID=A0ABP0JAG6_9DINO